MALEQPFDDEARGANLDAHLAFEQPLQRQEEIVQRDPPALDLVKFGLALDPLRADGEERFHRLDENRKRDPVGKRGRCGDVDRPEGRDRFGKDAGLRQARQIFVLADEADLRVRTGQPQRLGKDRSERGSWIVVGADDRRDIAARERGADARDLGNWIGDAVETLSPTVDQLL